jgi:hypothetical protein
MRVVWRVRSHQEARTILGQEAAGKGRRSQKVQNCRKYAQTILQELFIAYDEQVFIQNKVAQPRCQLLRIQAPREPLQDKTKYLQLLLASTDYIPYVTAAKLETRSLNTSNEHKN